MKSSKRPDISSEEDGKPKKSTKLSDSSDADDSLLRQPTLIGRMYYPRVKIVNLRPLPPQAFNKEPKTDARSKTDAAKKRAPAKPKRKAKSNTSAKSVLKGQTVTKRERRPRAVSARKVLAPKQPSIKTKSVSFDEVVEVIHFSRALGGEGVPTIGTISLCIDDEIHRSTEKLIDRINTSPEDCFLTPKERATVLKEFLGEDTYVAGRMDCKLENNAVQIQRQQSATDGSNLRLLPSSIEEAIEQAHADAEESRR